MRRQRAVMGATLLVAAACAPAADPTDDVPQRAGLGDREPAPLYEDLGSHGREITTASSDAQAYFDQGLRLQYAFNHAEAIDSYLTALSHDPRCAMCWWGIALARGPNVNGAMDPAAGVAALEAIDEARSRAGSATELERRLIEALARRYDIEAGHTRGALDSAYALAMGELAAEFAGDDDVLTLYAAALMNLSPWDYWSGDYGDRVPKAGTPVILETLEAALEIDHRNPGACHYYIHAVEAAHPGRAEACADRLAELMPGAGHIVHMPGHVYIRVGRYRDAVTANEHAVHADETYIADRNPMGVYPAAYYPHNYHFMAFAATMAGMSERAAEASAIVSPRVPVEVATEVPWIQNAIVLPQLTAITFGRWDDALALSMPDAGLHQATAMAWYARGVAHAARGEADSARAALEALRDVVARHDPAGGNPVLAIALHALPGEIGLRTGDAGEALERFRTAVALEDEMMYEEPPLWYYPLRHSLGRVLLETGQAGEAESVYRRDLERFPNNGWSLFGLIQSLEAQGKDGSAAREAFEEAWRHADVELEASRF